MSWPLRPISALIVIEAHSPATELFSKHPILLAKIFNDLQLAVVHPPGDGDQQKPEWVDHSLRIQTHYRDRRATVANHLIFMQIQLLDHTRPMDAGSLASAWRRVGPENRRHCCTWRKRALDWRRRRGEGGWDAA
jgi:hypothetical protein